MAQNKAKRMSLHFDSSITSVESVDKNVAKGVLRVCYTGKNRNHSFISKEAIEAAIPSAFNCPVVCNYLREENNIGSHDSEVYRDDDGNVKLVNITQPVGVVPESATYHWETIEEEDFSVHEYFCIDVLLWKRQEAYELIEKNKVTKQSMEITVTDGEMQDGFFIIEDFVFTAFCLLGEDVEPCFESASLRLFGLDDFKEQFSLMMEEIKSSLIASASTKVDAINKTIYNPEGGKKSLDEKQELMQKFGLTDDDVDFNLDDYTIDQLEKKFAFMKEEKEKESDFSLTSSQLTSEICESLGEKKICDEYWGEVPEFLYIDHDPEMKEVYVYRFVDWKLFGVPYSMDGDKVVIDFAGCKRKKFAYVDFDEGSDGPDYQYAMKKLIGFAETSKESELKNTYSGELAGVASELDSAKQTISSMSAELDELRQYKISAEGEKRVGAENSVFSNFSDLDGVQEFEDLKKNCSDLEIASIEEKCFAIRGRSVKPNFNLAQPKSTKLPVESSFSESGDEPYGGIFVEFGKKN